MGNDNNESPENAWQARERRITGKRYKPALRPHTFGTWKAIRHFYDSLPAKKRYWPTIAEIEATRGKLDLPHITRQSIHKQIDLLEEAGKLNRKPEGRRDIIWCAQFDADAAYAEATKLANDDAGVVQSV